MHRFVVLGVLALTSWGLAAQVTLVATDPAPLPGAQVGLTVSGVPAGAECYWDFGGDGTVDQVTATPSIPYLVRAGYQEIAVQVRLGDSAVGSARIALSADPSLGVFRTVSRTETGSYEVTVVLRTRVHLYAPAIEEFIPAGWSVEVIDVGGAVFMVGESLQAVWALELWPGDEVALRYVLYPGPVETARLSGSASGYGPAGRIEVQIGGAVVIP